MSNAFAIGWKELRVYFGSPVAYVIMALFLIVTAFNLIGDGLREALDPRAQGALEPSAFIVSDQNRAMSPAPIPAGGDPRPAA